MWSRDDYYLRLRYDNEMVIFRGTIIVDKTIENKTIIIYWRHIFNDNQHNVEKPQIIEIIVKNFIWILIILWS